MQLYLARPKKEREKTSRFVSSLSTVCLVASSYWRPGGSRPDGPSELGWVGGLELLLAARSVCTSVHTNGRELPFVLLINMLMGGSRS